jgi:transcriptional regulator with XRE-family HTH domain
MPQSRQPTAEQDQIILGQALRALRKGAGMTEEQLTERLGVDPTFIGRLERGQRRPLATIRRILTALNTSPSDFATAIEAAEHQPHT